MQGGGHCSKISLRNGESSDISIKLVWIALFFGQIIMSTEPVAMVK